MQQCVPQRYEKVIDMSFSSDLKEELLHITAENPCCLLAESYGLMLFGRAFSSRELSISTENEAVAQKYQYLAKRLCLHAPEMQKQTAKKYKVSVTDSADRLRVLSAFGCDGTERVRRLNWVNITEECCVGAFLRGAFLACGTINSPEKNYHLEFVVPHYNLCCDLKKFLENNDFSPKEVRRSGLYVLYFKKTEEIQNLLGIMGAAKFVMEFIDIIVYKDIRNNVNRRLNFENANLNKTVNAAMQQIEWIGKLKKSTVFPELPADLQAIAELRLENPDYSLQQIGDALTPPMPRSGVNHRLKKLCAMAEKQERK